MSGRTGSYSIGILLSAEMEDSATRKLLAASQMLVLAKVDPCAALEATCVAAARCACEVVLRATLAKQTIHDGGVRWNTHVQLSETEDAALFAAQERSASRRAEVDNIARRAVNLFRELLDESAEQDLREPNFGLAHDERNAGTDVQRDAGTVRVEKLGKVYHLRHTSDDRSVVSLPDLRSETRADREGLAGVVERGHGDLPSVGARASEAPDAAEPTVGAPTDTSADPSAVGVSVDQGEQLAALTNDIDWLTFSRRPGPADLAESLIERGWRKP